MNDEQIRENVIKLNGLPMWQCNQIKNHTYEVCTKQYGHPGNHINDNVVWKSPKKL